MVNLLSLIKVNSFDYISLNYISTKIVDFLDMNQNMTITNFKICYNQKSEIEIKKGVKTRSNYTQKTSEAEQGTVLQKIFR